MAQVREETVNLSESSPISLGLTSHAASTIHSSVDHKTKIKHDIKNCDVHENRSYLVISLPDETVTLGFRVVVSVLIRVVCVVRAS